MIFQQTSKFKCITMEGDSQLVDNLTFTEQPISK